MKLIRTSGKRLQFHLEPREKDLLFGVLNFYPCVPAGYQSLSKTVAATDADENQKLLEQALDEHRAESKARLMTLLSHSKNLVQQGAGWRLSLSRGELEWLLQVLNDIRVGSWVRLGSPEKRLEVLTEETAPHYWAMEMAGTFQMALLEAAGDP